jgi:hypothetical protein
MRNLFWQSGLFESIFGPLTRELEAAKAERQGNCSRKPEIAPKLPTKTARIRWLCLKTNTLKICSHFSFKIAETSVFWPVYTTGNASQCSR